MKRKTIREPESARSILSAVLRKRGLHAALSRHSVVTNWPKIVGPALAAHAKAEKVSGSTLHVMVDSSVWMHELAALKNVLLEKINSRLSAQAAPIEDIRFRQRSWVSTPSGSEEELSPPEPDESHLRTVSRVLEPVKDSDLRELLARILEKDRTLKWRRKAST